MNGILRWMNYFETFPLSELYSLYYSSIFILKILSQSPYGETLMCLVYCFIKCPICVHRIIYLIFLCFIESICSDIHYELQGMKNTTDLLLSQCGLSNTKEDGNKKKIKMKSVGIYIQNKNKE